MENTSLPRRGFVLNAKPRLAVANEDDEAAASF
jgi:hypothetical protein